MLKVLNKREKIICAGIIAGALVLSVLFVLISQNKAKNLIGLKSEEEKNEFINKTIKLEQMFRNIYQNLRLVSLMPFVRGIEGGNLPEGVESAISAGRFDVSSKNTIQQIFNNLEDNVNISEVYCIVDGFAPEKGETPFFMYDEPTLGKVGDIEAKYRMDPEFPEEYEDDEYNWFVKTLLVINKAYPEFKFRSIDDIPSYLSPKMRTCDNTQYISKKSGDINNSMGFALAVPFYGIKGQFKGVVAAIFRANILEAFLLDVPFIPVTQEDHALRTEQEWELPEEPGKFLLSVDSLKGEFYIFDRRAASLPGIYEAIMSGEDNKTIYIQDILNVPFGRKLRLFYVLVSAEAQSSIRTDAIKEMILRILLAIMATGVFIAYIYYGAIRRQLTEHKAIEEILKDIALGITGTTSQEVFNSLVKYLSKTLMADYAFVGELKREKDTYIRTVAVCANGEIIENFNYSLVDTPCENVIGGSFCYHYEDVREKFPKDELLTRLEINEYLGTPLVDSSGKTIGLIVALGKSPIKKLSFTDILFEICAVRAAIELERMRVEEEKQVIWNQFLQSQKLETIGLLSGRIAHDFNNILTPIIGFSELVYERLPGEMPEKEMVRKIHDYGDKASKLIDQLLTFSKKQVLKMEPCNLNQIIDNMGDLLVSIIGEDITLNIRTGEDIHNINGDDTQIQQIILNLVVNARQAMPDGGTLLIETQNVVIDDEYSSMHQGLNKGDYVVLSVEDTGVGMTPEVQMRIFEPFFTTKGKEKGTGLGLSTVYGIVKQHNGFIWTYSEPEKGTVFKVYFPVAMADIIKEAVKAPAVSAGGTETVLVVDDKPIIHQMIARMLIQKGYRVLEAGSAKEALNIQGDIDLLITDVVMPDMNGWELYQEIMKKRPAIKVLFASGFIESPIVLFNIQEKGYKFIKKPIDIHELFRKVREVLDET